MLTLVAVVIYILSVFVAVYIASHDRASPFVERIIGQISAAGRT